MAQDNLQNDQADWLAALGPRLRPGEVMLLLDGILVKGRPKGSKIEESCARIATTDGFLYLSGQGQDFQLKVQAALKQLTTHQPITKLTVIADVTDIDPRLVPPPGKISSVTLYGLPRTPTPRTG